MSTPTPPTTDAPAAGAEAESPAPAADVQGTEPDDGTEDSAARKARREAAGLRTRLREVEAAHDALEARTAAYERDHLARLATDAGFADPRDAFDLGVLSVGDPALRGEDGTLDEEAVTAALKAVLAERGHLRGPVVGFDQGNLPPAPSDGASWAGLFR